MLASSLWRIAPGPNIMCPFTSTIDTELRAWIGNYNHAQLGGCGHSRFSRAIQAAVEVCTASTLPVKRRFHLRRNTPAIQGANSVG